MLTMAEKVGRFDVNAVPMTKARPRLTEIVDDARDRDVCTALTEYGRPRAFVVSVGFFEAANRLDDLARALKERHPDLFDELLQGLQPSRVPSKMIES